MTKQSFSHILQKKGVLKNFTMAKVIPKKKIEEVKKMVKKKAKDEAEYKKMLVFEMLKLGNMHGTSNPIPGIIYDRPNKGDRMMELSKAHINMLKSQNLTKSELCFCILTIIHSLKLTSKDFESIDPEEFGGKNPTPGDDGHALF